MNTEQTSTFRKLLTLVLFGVSFGYVEAAVVVYLRALYEPLAMEFSAERKPGDLFPLITLGELEAADPIHLRRLRIEVMRQAATLVMMASVGLAIGWSFNTFLTAFVIAFGVWDIAYYIFLKALIDWPASLLDWDLLFLIPCPWTGPVLAPLIVASSMIIAGAIVLWRESTGTAVRIGWRHWSMIVLGGVIIVVSFCWDYRNVMAGGAPNPFQWSIFRTGEVVGLAGFFLGVRRNEQFGGVKPLRRFDSTSRPSSAK